MSEHAEQTPSDYYEDMCDAIEKGVFPTYQEFDNFLKVGKNHWGQLTKTEGDEVSDWLEVYESAANGTREDRVGLCLREAQNRTTLAQSLMDSQSPGAIIEAIEYSTAAANWLRMALILKES